MIFRRSIFPKTTLMDRYYIICFLIVCKSGIDFFSKSFPRLLSKEIGSYEDDISIIKFVKIYNNNYHLIRLIIRLKCLSEKYRENWVLISEKKENERRSRDRGCKRNWKRERTRKWKVRTRKIKRVRS